MNAHELRVEVVKKFEDTIRVKRKLLESEAVMTSILKLSSSIIDCLRADGKVIFCGNGGSFADAQHLSAEFTSRFMFDRPSLPSLALGTNSSAMSAVANDYGYENVFSREISSIGKKNDVFIGISTSGRSANVINALSSALNIGMATAVLTGARPEVAKDFPETNVIMVPSTDTALIQESHITIGHILCGVAEAELFRETGLPQ